MRLGLTLAPALLAAALVAAPLGLAAGSQAHWPSDSLHHLDLPIETPAGGTTRLAATGGYVRLATMFYASCQMTCPLIIDTLRAVEHQLTTAERARLRVLLVTFDPQRDTAAALSALAKARRIEASRWTLARTSPEKTRELAAALGIQYRRLDDGNFSHGSTLVLLSADGRVLARTSTLGKPDADFVGAIRRALADHRED